MFKKQTLADVDFVDKVVLVRVDYNVPLHDGRIVDDNRIRASLETIKELAAAKQIILLSHLGRPKGKDQQLSLRLVAIRLANLLGQSVEFVANWQKYDFEQSQSKIILLENLRFDEREQANDALLASGLVDKTKAELFVQDGFAVCHRRSATTDAITRLLPSVASSRLANEYQMVTNFLAQPKRPLLAIVGGAKISDKIDFIKQLVETVDYLVIGGAMANTFLLAQGYQVGVSFAEADQVNQAKQIIDLWLKTKPAEQLIIPNDVKVTTDLQSEVVVIKTVDQISSKDIVADIGPQTTAQISNFIESSAAILWNGNLGYTENPLFADSTKTVVDSLISCSKPVLIGGGDTVAFVKNNLSSTYNPKLYLSTGGGAMLELIAYGQLPGVEALLDKN